MLWSWKSVQKLPFFELKICPKFLFSLFWFFFPKSSSFCKENDISQKKEKDKKITILCVENLSNYVAQHN